MKIHFLILLFFLAGCHYPQIAFCFYNESNSKIHLTFNQEGRSYSIYQEKFISPNCVDYMFSGATTEFFIEIDVDSSQKIKFSGIGYGRNLYVFAIYDNCVLYSPNNYSLNDFDLYMKNYHEAIDKKRNNLIHNYENDKGIMIFPFNKQNQDSYIFLINKNGFFD